MQKDQPLTERKSWVCQSTWDFSHIYWSTIRTAPNGSTRARRPADAQTGSALVMATLDQVRAYEIHLTIAPLPTAHWPAFERYAASIGAKPMVIELARGQYRVQPMLTLGRTGELDDVIRFAQALAHRSAQLNYDVLRCKIEQDASACAASPDSSTCHYLEWHGRIVVAEPTRSRLAALCERFGGHLSNNAISGGDRRYVTLRETAGFASLAARVSALHIAISEHGWVISKQQWERVVYDSNLTLDLGWLESVI